MVIGKILIVEDEKSMNDILKILLEGEGYEVYSANDGAEGLEYIRKDIFDIVITDIKMPGVDGFYILREIKDMSPETIVIMITAFGTEQDGIDAMKSGAYDYINKPFKIDEIRLIVKNALEKRYLSREVRTLREQVVKTYRMDNIVGKSKAMVELLMSIPKVAESNSNVLIFGESGCGKELISHAVHALSKRSDKDLIPINCAAFPEGLLESELFGYMKGSFTGATSNKEGMFEVADGGTIFLDEIGDMPANLQAKLLRVLEDGTFRRIGGTRDLKVDVRIISATNKNLKEESASGRFRQDLYYRLDVIPLNLPPLRDRRGDVPVLIDHFLEKRGNKGKAFSKEAIEAMENYVWPGNVRELENTIERLLTFSEGTIITHEDLPSEIRQYSINKSLRSKESEFFPESANPVELTSEGVNLDGILEGIEMTYINKALQLTNGLKTEAAKLLNISFRQLRHRLKKYNIE